MTSKQFFTVIGACVAGWLRRVPWVFELRDMWPDSIRSVGAVRRGRVIRFLERIEYLLYRRASAIVAVTESFRRVLVERCMRAEN